MTPETVQAANELTFTVTVNALINGLTGLGVAWVVYEIKQHKERFRKLELGFTALLTAHNENCGKDSKIDLLD